MEKIAGYYIRVSSERQRDEQSIESQRDEITEDIKRDKNKLKYRWEDDGYTGGSMNRPGLTKLFEDLSNGSSMEILYITDLDRLARDLKDQITIFDKLKKHNVGVICKGKALEDTPEGKMVAQMQGMFAEYRRNRIAEDCKRGRQYWVRKGRIISAFAPFGYKFNGKQKDEKKLLIDKEQSKTVKLIFNLYLVLKSCYKLMEELNKRGIVNKRGKPFNVRALHHILTNEAYIGNWYYWKTKSIEPKERRSAFTRIKKSSTRKTKPNERVAVQIPALINKDKFNTIQEILKKNRKVYGKEGYFSLLRGLGYCAKCGSRLYQIKSHRWFYYKCSRKVLKHSAIDRPDCDAKTIRADFLNEAVWNYIIGLIKNPAIFKQYITILQEDDGSDKIAKEEEKRLLAKKEEVKKRKKKVLQAYEIDDDMTTALLTERIEELNQEEIRMDAQLKEVEFKLSQRDVKEKIDEVLENISENVVKDLESFTDEQKRIFLRFMIKRFTFNTDTNKLRIEGHLPLKEFNSIKEDDRVEQPIFDTLCPILP